MLYLFYLFAVISVPVSYTHLDVYKRQAQYRMVSVTQAFTVDLTGQVCADQFEGAYSTPMWTRIPRETGHVFHPKLDTDSTGNWTVEVTKRRAG